MEVSHEVKRLQFLQVYKEAFEEAIDWLEDVSKPGGPTKWIKTSRGWKKEGSRPRERGAGGAANRCIGDCMWEKKKEQQQR